MNARRRPSVQPRLLDLERRLLLAAPVLPGNAGQVVRSQFQPYGFASTVGAQVDGVRTRGPIVVDVAGATDPGGTTESKPINSGLIQRSQFNGGGFRTVGLQFQRIRVGGGIHVHGADDENPGRPTPGTVTAAAGGIFATFGLLINKGLIRDSQVNDGGFGVLERTRDGRVAAREGRVGLQWQDTRVGGPVDVGLDDVFIRPGTPVTAAGVVAQATPGTTTIDPTTNSGRIRNSQFNDGGFGDIGMQWTRVGVGGRVATSTNTLFINPRVNGTGPITVANRTFGAGGSGSTVATAAAAAPTGQVRAAGGGDRYVPLTQTNAATNSGRLNQSQFNDGGFGDVGFQWKKVRVRGDVTAVHNSLTVQPENVGQGFITVRDVRLPNAPAAPARGPRRPLRELDTVPAAVVDDGEVAGLPTPTGPLSPFFPTPLGGPGTINLPFPGNLPLVNAATNSGQIRGGQFSGGGFGDQGLQWLNVRVGGHVRAVHNSLSVHPEGSLLAGIDVADVAYGPPVSRRAAKQLATLPTTSILPFTIVDAGKTAKSGGLVLAPPNDRELANQQLAAAKGTDVFLQWNGIVRRGGTVIVHNTIKLTGVGPSTGPITLSNIRFPFRTPDVRPIVTVAAAGTGTVAAAADRDPTLMNASNNSGILDHAQVSDGGFGDDGLQWRNVRVDGDVDVVHNTLAVDAAADYPSGTPANYVAGPITVNNVTFNSGALNGVRPGGRGQLVLSPGQTFQRRSSLPLKFGHALPSDPDVIANATNTGILHSGQLAAGGANHVLLQWQGVHVRGPVKVIDNVLAISVRNRPSGPITISNVTFA